MKVTLEDESGRRARPSSDFPIVVRRGASGSPSFDGTGEALVAIGVADGHLFARAEPAAAALLNGAPLRDTHWLDTGDRIQVADAVISLDGDKRAPCLRIANTPRTSAPTSASTRTPTAPTGRLDVPLSQLIQERLATGASAELVIGRAASCDLVLAAASVSKEHARVRRSGSGYVIEDLHSTNGTYVNGRRIDAETPLGPSDLVLISVFQLSLSAPGRDIREQPAIEAVGLEKTYPGGNIGLHRSDFSVPGKSMTAIMGPSGCGKSTLLKCLNGAAPGTAGVVRIHGLDLRSHFEYLKSRIGYVPQDDIVHGRLTVRQSLEYACHLNLVDANASEQKARIASALAQLGLEAVVDNRVDALSGGQRKRVSIAVELLSDPLVLFLDEPTSPLDPQTIDGFLTTLRDLSVNRGTTIIMVTHKPEDLVYMDSVMFLARGGHLTYHGPTEDFTDHFGAEHVVEVFAKVADDEAQSWVHRFQRGRTLATPPDLVPITSDTRSVSALRQLFWLSARYAHIKVNDRGNLALLLAQPVIIAAFTCAIFQSLNLGVLFFVAVSAVWFGINNAAREIVGELAIMRRERLRNLRFVPYVASKILVLSVIATIQCAVFIGILTAGFSSGDPPLDKPVELFGWMTFVSCCATSLGLLISATVDRVEKVMTAVPILIIPQVMLAGVLEPLRNVGVEILSYVTFSRWATEGFALIQGRVHGTISPLSNPPDEGPIDAIEGAEPIQSGALEVFPGGGLHDRYHEPLFQELPGAGQLTLDATALALQAALLLGATVVMLRRRDTLR